MFLEAQMIFQRLVSHQQSSDTFVLGGRAYGVTPPKHSQFPHLLECKTDLGPHRNFVHFFSHGKRHNHCTNIYRRAILYRSGPGMPQQRYDSGKVNSGAKGSRASPHLCAFGGYTFPHFQLWALPISPETQPGTAWAGGTLGLLDQASCFPDQGTKGLMRKWLQQRTDSSGAVCS